jgi:hypothetical protein
LSVTGAGSIQGLTVGRGAGAVATNTALGASALAATTTGINNTAIGYQTLDAVTTGGGNVACGNSAGGALSTGSSNTFIGEGSGSTTTGDSNTFLGRDSGYLITSGANNTILGRFSGNQGGVDIRTASNFIVLSDGSGNPVVFTKTGQTFVLQGGNSSAGIGIAFPATQAASSDANTLDDYEEGTWTPTLRGSSTAGSYTISVSSANYTKIGRQVTVSCQFNTTAVGSAGTGYAQITGLPFTNVGQASGSCYLANVDLDAACLWCDVEFITDTGSSIVYFNTIRDNASSLDTQISGFGSSSYIRFTLTYNAST